MFSFLNFIKFYVATIILVPGYVIDNYFCFVFQGLQIGLKEILISSLKQMKSMAEMILKISQRMSKEKHQKRYYLITY